MGSFDHRGTPAYQQGYRDAVADVQAHYQEILERMCAAKPPPTIMLCADCPRKERLLKK